MISRYLTRAIAFLIIVYSLANGLRADFPDTRVYYEAAKGHDLERVIPQPGGQSVFQGWLYADHVRYLFVPLSWFRWEFARLLWFSIQAAAFVYLVERLANVTTIAPIIVTAASWPIAWFLSGSNVSISLLALSTTPIGAALAAGIKPYCGIIVVMHFVAHRISNHHDQTVSNRRH